MRAGRVSVNGRVAALGESADPDHDTITLDGQPLAAEARSYWLLHKPRGVVTTASDPEGRRTVLDLVPDRSVRLFPVGRLDRDTEGLLLLTNDGEVAQALLHPSLETPRVYRVSVRGRLTEQAAERLASGVELEEGITHPARVGRLHVDAERDITRFELTLHEGRKRQIRRSLEALGYPVVRLVRIRMGPLRLDRLPLGRARPLRPDERRQLLAYVRARRR